MAGRQALLRQVLWLCLLSGLTGINTDLVGHLASLRLTGPGPVGPSVPLPSGPPCPTDACRLDQADRRDKLREHRKSLRLANIKDDILAKLGLSRKPDLSQQARSKAYTRSVKKVLERLWLKKAGRGRRGSQVANGAYQNEISEIVSMSEEEPFSPTEDMMRFTLHADSPEGELQVLRASLWVLVRYKKWGLINNRAKQMKITVGLVGKEGRSRVITTSLLRIKHTSWKQLILPTSLIRKTLQSNQRDLVFRVNCHGCQPGGPEVVLLHRQSARKQSLKTRGKRRTKPLYKRRPFIIIETRMKEDQVLRLFRGKRDLSQRHSMCNHAPCCKVSRRFVTFRELDWDDWIISPRGFHVTSCNGQCSRRKSDVNIKCSPTRRSPLQIMYSDGKAIFIRDLRDMIIEDCTCM